MEKIDAKPNEVLHIAVPIKLTMSPKYAKGNLHITFGDVGNDIFLGEDDDREPIMTILGCLGGGVEIQDKLTNETWFLSFKHIADSYRHIQVNRVSENPTEQGVCPDCGHGLNYDGYSMQDDSLCHSVSCLNEECGWNGTEWYRTVFDNIADITGEPL